MKKIIVFALLFSCLFVFTEAKKLPRKIVIALENKYPGAEIENWRVAGNLYYLNIYLVTDSYTSIFTPKGVWIETSGFISELDIPVELEYYISENYEEGRISYCEKVETSVLELIRVSLYNNGEFILLQSEIDGSNIKIVKRAIHECYL